jgi:RNA recognition motif-containing protein
MTTKVRVENLPSDITEERLQDVFAQIGDVQSVTIKTDLLTGRPKGYGFVEMSLDVDAYRAVNILDGTTFKDRRIHLKEEKITDREGQRDADVSCQKRRKSSREQVKNTLRYQMMTDRLCTDFRKRQTIKAQ